MVWLIFCPVPIHFLSLSTFNEKDEEEAAAEQLDAVSV